jgi:hypothetical protein
MILMHGSYSTARIQTLLHPQNGHGFSLISANLSAPLLIPVFSAQLVQQEHRHAVLVRDNMLDGSRAFRAIGNRTVMPPALVDERFRLSVSGSFAAPATHQINHAHHLPS